MVNLALWLKKNNFETDQVQNFYPSPMCNATSMYYSETNPLKRVKYKKREDVPVAKGERQRRLHKALLRYHDPDNWPLIREALTNMGKKHLIGDKPNCLVPETNDDVLTPAQRRKSGRHGSQRFATKHTKNQPGFGSLRGEGNRDGKQGSKQGGDNRQRNNDGNPQRSGQRPQGNGQNQSKGGFAKPNQRGNNNQGNGNSQSRGTNGSQGKGSSGKGAQGNRPASSGNRKPKHR